MQDITVEEFCMDLMKIINQEDVDRLVIDLRNNLGGNSTLLEPFISELSSCHKLNRVGGIYVILGRETFSSALLNAYALKNKTSAIFIGEATGGKPNCYGEVKSFELRNSKLQIRYSTKYYKIIEDDEQESFFPDVNTELTFKDYKENRDPCMECIL
jgi:C-terminal processing protease CtpA/Prc